MFAIRLTAALVSLAALTSCGGPPASGQHGGQPRSVVHNAADVTFVHNMVPHHQQAVEMSAMVPGHTANRHMLVIAKDISADQQAEIHAMTVLVGQWGESGAAVPDSHADHHGMQPMSGMVDPATIDRLQTLDGNAFDDLWLRSMIGHHQGAVTMAQDEMAHGQSKDAIDMATNIVSAQQREIAYMTHLLSPAQ